MKLLACFVLPCFAAECSYKIWWYSSGASQIPFLGNVYLSDATACILELFSWLYRTTIFFLVCVLYRLICYLQILRLQDFTKVFQEESEVESVLKEHLRIRRQLTVISHRYRGFIMLALAFVTASQFAALLSTTRTNANLNIFMAGELAVSDNYYFIRSSYIYITVYVFIRMHRLWPAKLIFCLCMCSYVR